MSSSLISFSPLFSSHRLSSHIISRQVKCLSTIRKLPNVEEMCKGFCDFYLRVLKTALLAQMLEEQEAQN
jgi:hypothetical protein